MLPAAEPGRVDAAVIGQSRGWEAVLPCRNEEVAGHNVAGDQGVRD